MINKLQILRYRKYNGDLSKWVKSQKNGLDEILSGADWSMIDKMIQRLRIQKTGIPSSDYTNETDRVLKKFLESEEVAQIAREMA